MRGWMSVTMVSGEEQAFAAIDAVAVALGVITREVRVIQYSRDCSV